MWQNAANFSLGTGTHTPARLFMAHTPKGDGLRPSHCSHSHPNPSNRQFGAPSFSQSNRGSADMAFISTCVGNGAASHHHSHPHRHRSPSPRPGNSRQGRGAAQQRCQITTTVHFRLTQREPLHGFGTRIRKSRVSSHSYPISVRPAGKAWTYWCLEILGSLIGGGDSGFRLWQRRGSCCPEAGCHSALWDALDWPVGAGLT